MDKTEMLIELEKLLADIRDRPGMFIGSKSLIKLRIFIDGFLYAFHIASGKKEYVAFYPEFQDWISNRYNISKPHTHSWNSIISFFSVDEVEAFDTFYKLFDEFLLVNLN